MDRAETTIGHPELTPEQRKIVLQMLHTLLDSPHFRKSKRYPALTDYLVRNSLEGNFSSLKERVLGVEALGRSADYDTGSDSVVRIAAAEVRRRMALYFSEHPESPVRFDLPAGSYVVEFHFHTPSASPAAEGEANLSGESVAQEVHSAPARRWHWTWTAGLIILGLLLFGSASFLIWRIRHPQIKRDFWTSVLRNSQRAEIVTGGGPEPPIPGGAGERLQLPGSDWRDENQLSFGSALAIGKICGIFSSYQRDCKVIPAQSVNLTDLHNDSLVLVGAFDNILTKRFLSSLRYQFRSEGYAEPSERQRRIVDTFSADGTTVWLTGPSRPAADGADYAIVGRFHSDLTDGMVVVAAGIGPQGTNSAGYFLTSPESWAEILAVAPKNWKGINFEAVLQTDIVQGNAGRGKIVAAYFW